MPYKALDDKSIFYVGNNLHKMGCLNTKTINSCLSDRVLRIKTEKMFFHLENIDDAIFKATVEYFSWVGAKWANLPLTTLMISSPWEVYAGQILDYTSDTLPIEIPNWFWDRKVFLAESSQFYLELLLLWKWIDQVFSIYNSFRKEKSDMTHLSEFQHIEYEWKIDLEGNIKVFLWLYEYVFEYLLKNNEGDLLFFLSEDVLKQKRDIVKKWPQRISFKHALDLLYKSTKDERYKEFSLKNFGSWEEIKLTEILNTNVIVEKYPMLQIPFYHSVAQEEFEWVPLAKNADFILYWYRETIGAGERIKEKEVLLKKAEIFNLPKEDYMPYLQSRDFNDYETTSWFGMGRQRFVHWLLDQPYIYESTIFPRTHLIPNP